MATRGPVEQSVCPAAHLSGLKRCDRKSRLLATPARWVNGLDAMDERPIQDGTIPSTSPPPQTPIGLQLDLAPLAERVAQHVVEVVREQIELERRTPWMLMEEAIAYTRVPAGTFRKWVADGRVPAHGGKRKLFHRDELDAALGYGSSGPSVPPAVPLRGRA